jgi:hypothetical protein
MYRDRWPELSDRRWVRECLPPFERFPAGNRSRDAGQFGNLERQSPQRAVGEWRKTRGRFAGPTTC